MKKEIKSLIFVGMLLLLTFLNPILSTSAEYTVDHASFPPDLPGDVNNDACVNVLDLIHVARALSSEFQDEWWDPTADVNDDGRVNVLDLINIAASWKKKYSIPSTPVAYSIDFEFSVPDDGDNAIHYYIICRFYVPSSLDSSELFFVASVDDWVIKVWIDSDLVHEGDTSDPPCQSVNVSLGILNEGYHILEMEYVEKWSDGRLYFYLATNGEYAQLDRFRIYVPNYGDSEQRYTVKTRTYFPGDNFFLWGYADDFIDDVYIDAGMIWRDWEWDSKEGIISDIYAWDFMYPLGWLDNWHNITFTFGEIWGSGVLDFQYLSQTTQQAKFRGPKFWAKVSYPISPYSPGDTRYLEIYDVEFWAGSKWSSTPGSSRRLIAVGIKVLANATDTYTFYPIPQEAEVTLILELPNPKWSLNSPQDIGLHINLTYTYFDEESFIYGFPIWFETLLVNVTVPTQGYMLYIPNPSIVFTTQSQTSYITPEWKAAWEVVKYLQAFLFTKLAGPVGAVVAAWNIWKLSEIEYRAEQQLNSTSENLLNPSTYREYTMNIFKTTEEQLPLSEPVRSISNGFFFRILPTASEYCGGVTVDLHGRLWLPFFYNNPPPDAPNWYGEWLPIDIEIRLVFPVFVED